MIVKQYRGRVFGANLTVKEQKALQLEINRQIIEADRKYMNDVDAMVLYFLFKHLGFKKKRLRQAWEQFTVIHDDLVRHNADLWEKILRYSLVHKLSAMWVKAHAGNAMNHRCDALANTEASTLEREAPQRAQVFTELLLDRTCIDSEISNKYRIPLMTVLKYRAQFFEHLRRHEKGDTGNGR